MVAADQQGCTTVGNYEVDYSQNQPGKGKNPESSEHIPTKPLFEQTNPTADNIKADMDNVSQLVGTSGCFRSVYQHTSGVLNRRLFLKISHRPAIHIQEGYNCCAITSLFISHQDFVCPGFFGGDDVFAVVVGRSAAVPAALVFDRGVVVAEVDWAAEAACRRLVAGRKPV